MNETEIMKHKLIEREAMLDSVGEILRLIDDSVTMYNERCKLEGACDYDHARKRSYQVILSALYDFI